MLLELLLFVVKSVFGFFTLAFLARFLMQWARAPFHNPLGRFIVAVTDWLVKPMRRAVPGAFGFDLASLLAGWLSQVLLIALALAISPLTLGAPGGIIAAVLLVALLETLRLVLYLLIGVVIVAAVLSWINPYAPLAPVFEALARPFLAPLQRIIPLIGGVDLSPLVLLLGLQVLLTLLAYLRHGLMPLAL